MNILNTITLKRTNSIDPDFLSLVDLLNADLDARYGELMQTYSPHNQLALLSTVVVAYLDGAAVGCACYKPFDEEAVEIKRMFVSPDVRGKGAASQILAELEGWAKEQGFVYIVLETGDKQIEAINLYHKLGYVDTEKYEPYIGLESSICMRKKL